MNKIKLKKDEVIYLIVQEIDSCIEVLKERFGNEYTEVNYFDMAKLKEIRCKIMLLNYKDVSNIYFISLINEAQIFIRYSYLKIGKFDIFNNLEGKIKEKKELLSISI